MNIQWMRKIDYFVGSLLCFALTFFFQCFSWGKKKGKPILDPKRVLFMKFLGMGSIVLSLPSIERVRKTYPNAEIYFITFAAHRGLFEMLPQIPKERVIFIRDHSLFTLAFDSLKAIWQLRQLKITVNIDLEFFSRYSCLMSFMAGSRYRIGFYNYHTEGLYRGNFLTHKVFYNCYQHTSLAFNDLVETLIRGDQLPYNKLSSQELPELEPIKFTDVERISVLRKFHLEEENYAIINANCTPLIPLRRWPPEYFVELIQKLHRENSETKLVLVGAPNEKEYIELLTQEIQCNQLVNLAGKTTLRELCVLLDNGKYFITNDSGPAHLASLTRAKVIALFGPETPKLYAPLGKRTKTIYLQLGCSPCVTIYNGKLTLCKDNQCLKRITPDMVLQSINET